MVKKEDIEIEELDEIYEDEIEEEEEVEQKKIDSEEEIKIEVKDPKQKKKKKEKEIGIVIQIQNGKIETFQKEGYKFNYHEYIIDGGYITVVDKDKKDLKPYIRYLIQNKKERQRHMFIFFILIMSFITLYSTFGIKNKVKSIKETVIEHCQKGDLGSGTGSVKKEIHNEVIPVENVEYHKKEDRVKEEGEKEKENIPEGQGARY